MRRSVLKYIFVLPLAALWIAFSSQARASCELVGQFVVFEDGPNLKIGVCSRGILGISSDNPYHADDLLRILEKSKSNQKFIRSLNQVGVGRDYASAFAEIKAFGGMLVLQGEKKDKAALDYLAATMNESDGVTERIKQLREAEAKEGAARESRRRNRLNVTIDSLKKMAEENRALAAELDPTRCQSIARETLNQLRILKVKFVDGEEGLMLPYEGKVLGNNVFEFKSPSSARGLGGTKFGEAPSKRRYLKFEDGKIYWGVETNQQFGGSVAFNEYEVSAFHEISAQDALGIGRPMNSSPTYDQCFYAKALSPKGREGQGGGTATK